MSLPYSVQIYYFSAVTVFYFLLNMRGCTRSLLCHRQLQTLIPVILQSSLPLQLPRMHIATGTAGLGESGHGVHRGFGRLGSVHPQQEIMTPPRNAVHAWASTPEPPPLSLEGEARGGFLPLVST